MRRFGYSFCIHSFVKNIPFLQFPIEFHKKSIPNFFFFAYVAVVPPSGGVWVVSVYTGILKFSGH